MKILVIDDEFGVLKTARRILRDHETYIASDTATAVGVASRHRPDAILLDIILADENGLDLIELLHKASPGSAIIIMTALSSVDVMRVAYASGADAFVPKDALGSVPAVLDDLMSERGQLSEP
jgi:DNA-binding response OmpR family regulator